MISNGVVISRSVVCLGNPPPTREEECTRKKLDVCRADPHQPFVGSPPIRFMQYVLGRDAIAGFVEEVKGGRRRQHRCQNILRCSCDGQRQLDPSAVSACRWPGINMMSSTDPATTCS